MQEKTNPQEIQVDVHEVINNLAARIAQLETEKAILIAQLKQLQAGKGES